MGLMKRWMFRSLGNDQADEKWCAVLGLVTAVARPAIEVLLCILIGVIFSCL